MDILGAKIAPNVVLSEATFYQTSNPDLLILFKSPTHINGMATTLRNQNTVVIGEVGLDGEVRAVSQIEPRIKEAEKLGFKRCIIPRWNKRNLNREFEIENIGVGEINETINFVLTHKSREEL